MSIIIVLTEFQLSWPYSLLVDFEASGGILEANANNSKKYIAQMTLSAATPAAKTDGVTPRASEIAM